MHSSRIVGRLWRPLRAAIRHHQPAINLAVRNQSTNASTVAQSLSVAHQIEARRQQSRLGGGERRLKVQHDKVRNSTAIHHCHRSVD